MTLKAADIAGWLLGCLVAWFRCLVVRVVGHQTTNAVRWLRARFSSFLHAYWCPTDFVVDDVQAIVRTRLCVSGPTTSSCTS